MSGEQDIEELTATIIEYHCYQHGCDDCGWKHSRGGCEEEPIYRDLARHLIEDAGYRKIIPNVDFVVRAGELATMREKAYNEARKETAKEIFKEVIKLLDEAVPHTKEFTTLLWLAGQIQTEYGVEVDE